jgi:glycosyltransferase involved in cell wall biosynthesis
VASESLSIIIPALNEGAILDRTVRSITETIGLGNYEIIIVNSGGTDCEQLRNFPRVSLYESGVEGPARAKNYGASKATSEFLVFSDSHIQFKTWGWGLQILKDIEISDSIIAPAIAADDNDNSRGYGYKWDNTNLDIAWLPYTTPNIHDIPFACGCCMAMKKTTFDGIGKFDSEFFSWGEEDTEISIRSWLLGHSVICDPSIVIAHKFRSSFPYEVKWINFIHNRIRLAFLHLNSKRLGNILKPYSNLSNDSGDFTKAILMNLEEGVLDAREALFNKRLYDDDWFFQKFPMNGLTTN